MVPAPAWSAAEVRHGLHSGTAMPKMVNYIA
jgi:hypothetical protein